MSATIIKSSTIEYMGASGETLQTFISVYDDGTVKQICANGKEERFDSIDRLVTTYEWAVEYGKNLKGDGVKEFHEKHIAPGLQTIADGARALID